MKNLQFERLVLLSDSLKSANQFRFQSRYNLITAKNNSVGKSTIIKNLLWCLGCEPQFDDTWKGFSCKVMVEFSIGTNRFIVVRDHNTILFSEDGKTFTKYTKITGAYSERIANILGFQVRLPNRYGMLETPPPAYYFLPFYIDQTKSWSEAWAAFNQLDQFTNWKSTIVKYHTGYLQPTHFQIQDRIFTFSNQKKEIDDEINQINTAINIVEKYVPVNHFAFTRDEFEVITKEVEEELSALSAEQEGVLSKITEIQSQRYHLNNQLDLAIRAVKEVEKDYQFTVENIDGDHLECPLCGTLHDNSLVSRAAILVNKQQAEEQVVVTREKVHLVLEEAQRSQRELDVIREKINGINKKYSSSADERTKYGLTNLVDGFASKSVQRCVADSKQKKEASSKNISDKQRDLKKEQKGLLGGKRKKELNAMFLSLLQEYIFKLDAKDANLSKVAQPTDYKSLQNSGGAAEGIRAILAYQVAIFNQIYKVDNEIPAPLIVDTPNQHEQAHQNYNSIIKLIMEDTPEESQVFLCAMENEQLKPYREKANVIFLNDNKLLFKEHYAELSKEMDVIISNAIRE